MRALTRRYLPYPGHTLAGRGTWRKSRLWSPNSTLRSPTRCQLVAWGRFPPPTCPLALPVPEAEQEALANKQRLLLDRAYRYLVDQGFGPLSSPR